MEYREALYTLFAALAMVAGGLTWAFGAYGLIGAGVAIAALVLVGFNIRKE